MVSRKPSKWRCHYCMKRRGVTTDHVVPLAQGGANEPWNFVPACIPCNARKADSMPTCECPYCTAAIAQHEQKEQR